MDRPPERRALTKLQKAALIAAASGVVLSWGLFLRFFIGETARAGIAESWGILLMFPAPAIPYVAMAALASRRRARSFLVVCLVFAAIALLFSGTYAIVDPRWREKPGSLELLMFVLVPFYQTAIGSVLLGAAMLFGPSERDQA